VFAATAVFYLNNELVLAAVIISDVFCMLIYLFSDRLLLMFFGAKISTNSKLNDTIATINSHLYVYLIDGATPKLLSVGESICMTPSVLNVLNRQELLSIVNRELIHIQNLNTKLYEFIQIISGPLAFLVLELIGFRSLESMNDIESAKLTGDPDTLANALEKMSNNPRIQERVKLLRAL